MVGTSQTGTGQNVCLADAVDISYYSKLLVRINRNNKFSLPYINLNLNLNPNLNLSERVYNEPRKTVEIAF